MGGKVALLLKVRDLARKFGVDIKPHPWIGKTAYHLPRYPVDVLIDAGANIGQYATEARRSQFHGRIISFEPVPDTFEQLRRRMGSDPSWTGMNLALGDKDEQQTINLFPDSCFNSLLDQASFMTKSFPAQRVRGEQVIQVRRLDGLAQELQLTGKTIWLKTDTQGFDMQVIRGAEGLLEQVRVVQAELSFRNIYVGQPPAEVMIGFLRKKGFMLMDLCPVSHDGAGLIEADGIFVRADQPAAGHN